MWRMMLLTLVTAVAVGCETTAPRAESDMGPERHVAFTPAQVRWTPGPASLPAGSEVAVLEGDPAEAGMFVMRLRFPDGYRIPPHWHPNFERVTVISGAFHLGMGDTFNPNATQRLGAGSFTVMPPGMRHYAVAEGETVVQITTVGPWEINYVNPADDPRGS